MKQVAKRTAAVLALLVSGWSANTFAIDSKVHPGSMCQARFGSQTSDFTVSASGIFNRQDGPRHVTCPIVRDTVHNDDGLSSVYVRVRRSSDANFGLQCFLQSVTGQGVIVEEDDDVFSGVGFNVLSLDVENSGVRGPYVVTCALPSRSSILSYIVHEFDEN